MSDEETAKRSRRSAALSKIKEQLDNALGEAKRSRIGWRLHDRRWSIQESLENAFKGYCDSDIVNLGDRIVEHYAGLLAYLSEQSYDNVEEDWFERLRPAAELLDAYGDALSELESVGWVFDGGSEPAFYKTPLAQGTYKTLKDSFAETWHWVGENILTERFSMPNGHAPEPKPPAIHVRSYYRSAAELVSEAHDKTRRAMRRHLSPNTFSKEDISEMPYSELKRTTEMLYEFASSSIGYPVGYHGSGCELKEREGEWEERAAIVASVTNSHAPSHATVGDTCNNTAIARNGEDADWSAWIEDISHAARVIDAWREWIEPGGLQEKMVKTGASQEQIGQIGSKLRGEFLRTWDWLGLNVDALWI